jgi:hypothetical protein
VGGAVLVKVNEGGEHGGAGQASGGHGRYLSGIAPTRQINAIISS